MKFRAKFYIFLICVSFLQPVHADILIRRPEVSPLEFSATLHARQSDQSYSQYLQKDNPTPQQKQSLREQFDQAQHSFLTETPEAARNLFFPLAAQAHVADWDRESRRMIFYAQMRLAQLSTSNADRSKWLQAATSFAPDLEPDANLFPPPLVAATKSVRSDLLKQSIDWTPFPAMRGFDAVVVDGRHYNLSDALTIQLTPGEHRVSLFSSVYAPFSQVMQAGDIRDFRLHREPMLEGTCEHPQLRGPLTRLKDPVVAVFPENCLAREQQGQWSQVEKTDSPIFAAKMLPTGEIQLPVVPEIPPAKPFYKKTWFWASVAALAVGAAVAIQSQQHQDRGTVVEPTHQ